jgi:uncharacterized BrkB/YihY/UPF0761 family membrane protein
MAVLAGLCRWLGFELSESRNSVSEISGTSPSDLSRSAQTGEGGQRQAIGILLALWSASKVITGFQTALNNAYETEDQRPYW